MIEKKKKASFSWVLVALMPVMVATKEAEMRRKPDPGK
jgi:hypothetical protein